MAEYPKWLHRDWKPTEGKQGAGHHEAAQSKLVHTSEEAKELLSKGWTEAAPAPKASPKKD